LTCPERTIKIEWKTENKRDKKKVLFQTVRGKKQEFDREIAGATSEDLAFLNRPRGKPAELAGRDV